MRVIGFGLLMLTGCFSPVVMIAPVPDAGTPDARTPDAGTFDAGSSFDAGKPDGGSGSICMLFDGGSTITPWCLEQASSQRRCSEASLVRCSDHPMAMAVDSTWIVWSTIAKEVFAQPLAGGPALKLDQSSVVPITVAVREGFAYWADTASVYRAPLDGGARETLATQQDAPRGMVVNATHAFWSAQSSIHSVALGGGAAQTLVPNENSPGGLGFDSTHLYWGSQFSGQIRRVPLSGGTPTTIYSGQMLPWKVRVVNGFVYWNSDWATGDIKRGPVGGGTPEVLATSQDVAREFVTDGVWLYWFAQGTNFGQPAPRIYRVPVAGGAIPEIILTPKRGGPLVFDATNLYFGSDGLWSLSR